MGSPWLASAGPEHVRRNDGARVGDTLILTKPVGVGIYSAAFKKDALSPESYAEMVAAMTQLNSIGADLAKNPDVHAITDVTGFGLLGHAMEMARGSGHTLIIRDEEVPLLADAERLAREGYITGASGRNWASYGASVKLPSDFPEWRRNLLTDPQTSGGLLISCEPERADILLQTIIAGGYPAARIIGQVSAGDPAIRVETARLKK